jgi:hypothetical protein
VVLLIRVDCLTFHVDFTHVKLVLSRH